MTLNSLTIARIVTLLTIGLVLAWSDLVTRRIPNKGIALFTVASAAVYSFNPSQFVVAVVCAILFAILLFPISMLRHKGLGGGDIKLIIVLALLLGRGSNIVAMLTLASLFAAVHLTIDWVRLQTRPKSIAFAPALIAGALLSL
jgi:Flp pilus assembly protein protease CpaA